MTQAIEKPNQSETQPMRQAATITPMEMIARHVERGGDIAQLEKLYELQQRYETDQARKAWNAAMNAFKADPPSITKNKRVSYSSKGGNTEYDHATLDQVASKISKAMAPHGLSFRWETDQSQGGISVTCIVAHKDGHSERTTLTAGADESGGKNRIQAVGSAVSYLQRYTLKAATGIAEQGQDDDGYAAEAPQGADRVTQEQADQITARLAETETDSGTFLRVFGKRANCHPLNSVSDIPASVADWALQVIDDNYRKRQEQSK